MKKLIALLISGVIMLPCVNAFANDVIEVYIDGEKLECDVNPKNIDERVLVPMRAIFEAFGANVSWDNNGRTVWAERNGEFICVPVDNQIMSTGVYNSDGSAIWVDQIQLDVPAKIIDDRTYVPVRAVSETLGATVGWDGENNRVVIDSRINESGTVYYASDSDYQKLYSVDKNSANRQKLSDNSVCELEMYDNNVYYLSKNDRHLYRANDISGEEELINKTVNKIAVDDGWIYYQESDGGKKSGVLYRMNIDSGDVERLTDNLVRYPKKYKDYIYFNLDNDNIMYGITLDGTSLVNLSMGDNDVKLYPFNCFYYGDYLFVENGVWYGNLMRISRDGSEVKTLNQINSLICKKQTPTDKILFVNQDNGKDIYCMNIDGTDQHLVVKGDASWINIELIAQWGDTIYYKNPFREEVYRVNLDGSDNNYVCYADDVKTADGRLITSYNGLYIGSLDASDLTCIYDKAVKKFDVENDKIYFVDKKSGKLYTSDFSGNVNVVTNESVGEWVSN